MPVAVSTISGKSEKPSSGSGTIEQQAFTNETTGLQSEVDRASVRTEESCGGGKIENSSDLGGMIRDSGMDFQQLLRTASQLKSCQLGSVRRYYETVPTYFQATRTYAERMPEVYKMSFEDRFQYCKDAKEEGNKFFREKSWTLAMAQYARAIAVFMWFKPMDVKGERLELQEYTAALDDNDGRKKQVKELLDILFTNQGMTLGKIGKQDDAMWTFHEAIKRNSANIKATFQLAMLHWESGTYEDFDRMKGLLQKAKNISKRDDSKSAQARKIDHWLAKVENRQAKQLRKDRSQYAGMFNSAQKGQYHDEDYKPICEGVDSTNASNIYSPWRLCNLL